MDRGPESFWDLCYRDGSYLEHWEPIEVPEELARLAASGRVPAGGTCLDVGCGAGLEALYLAWEGFRVIGVDSSEPALERARERAASAGVEVDFRAGSVFALPVVSGTVDLALDRGCFHCIDREDRPDYAREIVRVLRPGGLFLLRGARRDDEEQGVLGFDAAELDALFPAPIFTRGEIEPIELAARAGSLAANRVLLDKRA